MDAHHRHTLRPYQVEIIGQLRDAFAGHRSVCLQLATGGGKSIVAATMIVEMLESVGQAIYVVHRRELVRQTFDTLSAFGFRPGTIGVMATGYPETPWAPIQICQIQKLHARFKSGVVPWMDRVGMLVIDEAHHVRASTWDATVRCFPQAKCLGLTATPSRTDRRGLGTHFEALVIGPTVESLVACGALAPVEMYGIPMGLDMEGIGTSMGDYNVKDIDQRLTSGVIASGVKNTLSFAADSRFIHYAVNRRHSMEYAEAVSGMGLPCVHIDGDMPEGERDQVIRRFAGGTLQGISNVDIVSEGFDVPECDCVIMGRPTKSIIRWFQAIGRAMRPKSDGRPGRILDLAGNLSSPFPMPFSLDDVTWSLADGVRERHKETAPRRTSRICSNCGFVNAAWTRVCAHCQHEPALPVPREVDVSLVKQAAPPSPAQQRRRKKEINAMVIATGGDEAALRRLQVELGYHPNWVAHCRAWCEPIWRSQRAKAFNP